MYDQRQRSLILLVKVLAVINGLLALNGGIILLINPEWLPSREATLANIAIGIIAGLYYLLMRRRIERDWLVKSALGLTLATSLSFVIIIATTGGLNSPYYPLWLLAIVVAGIFGSRETFIVLMATLAYYTYEILTRDPQHRFLTDHLIQLAITIVAAGLAEWVHMRFRRASASGAELQNLSGQLTAEQLKAQALVQSIGDGVIVIDASGRIQLINRAAESLTGWDADSAEGIDCQLVLVLNDSQDQPVTEANNPFGATAAQRREQVVYEDLCLVNRHGRKVALNLSVSPIYGPNQSIAGSIALFRDISREKAVERQKDEFVSTASHEMRTPVAAIEGYISLAMNPNVATVDERAMKYLGKAHESIQHLGSLFKDLLSVTKAEDDSLNLKFEPVNVGHLLQGVVEDMQLVASKKNLTLVFTASVAGGKTLAPIYMVSAAPERLREVVMNLIDNAIKYTAAGGIKVTLNGDDKVVEIGVTDTGLGIAPEDAEHLFQKFYRIDSTATRTIGGTGLGLYLCRTLVERFGGRIWVTSKLGNGSTFHIELPRLGNAELSALQAQIGNGETPASHGIIVPQAAIAPGMPAPAAAPAMRATVLNNDRHVR